MHYDVVIIGAGMSGLAAGIRLAYFEKRVCIVEKHYAYGGLNSYYTLGGRAFDVGLHAVTNYVGSDVRSGPLPKIFRQLRLRREDFDLHPQRGSLIDFPAHCLRFTNDIAVLTQQVGAAFPKEAERFCRLVQAVRDYDDTRLEPAGVSARRVLRHHLRDPLLVEMLLCPILYYGGAAEHDLDFRSFVVLFKSIFLEGFARPREGVRTIIRALVKKYRACGGKLRMRTGVHRIEAEGDRAAALALSTGETLTADVILSSAGYFETMRLCSCAPSPHAYSTEVAGPAVAGGVRNSAGRAGPAADEAPGRISFVESIAVVDQPPGRLGHEHAIVFFNDADSFTYAMPGSPVDLRSGVLCCPNNYEGHEELREGVVRLTWLANYDRWTSLSADGYAAAKESLRAEFVRRAGGYLSRIADRIVFFDMFTPRTIEHYTGHIHGAVYGAPHKRFDGRTRLKNLFLCGTDQGYLGIVGAMISGITMANMHVLGREG